MTISFSRAGKMGRLGNTLFQIAATVAHAEKMKTDFAFPEWEYGHIIFPDNIKPEHDLALLERYKEPYFRYMPIPLKTNLNLVGFFQSEKYFENVKDVLVKEYTRFRKNGSLEGCSVHVRRTDYLTNQVLNVLPISYYKLAMSLINANQYHMYSDDIEWCMETFADDPKIIFHPQGDSLSDLLEMSQYESLIIANSSYSWWAAYCSLNPKYVIASLKWFKEELIALNTDDLIPKHWIQI